MYLYFDDRLLRFLIKISIWLLIFLYWLFSFPNSVWYIWENPRHDLISDDLISIVDKIQVGNLFELEKPDISSDFNDKAVNVEDNELSDINNVDLIRAERIMLQIISEALNWLHWSSEMYNENHLFQICSLNIKICNSIRFNWDFDLSQRLQYKAIIIYLINNYDSFINTSRNITSVLSSISINEQWWRRWYAWHQSILMNTKSIPNNREFWEVFTHELWHIIDLWVLIWNWRRFNSEFTEFWRPRFYDNDPSINFYRISWINENTRKSVASRDDFVSWYSMTNPFEDFAESVNMYLNHYLLFKEMSNNSSSLRQKFVYMDRLFNWQYINTDRSNLQKLTNNPSWRPWDSTKIY